MARFGRFPRRSGRRRPRGRALSRRQFAPWGSGAVPHVRGRGAVMAAEGAVEGGDVAEAAIIGDGADAHMGHPRVLQHPVDARQTARAHEFREGGALLLEQLLHVAARHPVADRKSTRLNSSHANISYAVFCLKKKKRNTKSMLMNY